MISLMVAVTLMLTVLPTGALAESLDVPSKLTLTYYSKNDVYWGSLSKNTTYLISMAGTVKNLKSSDKSVVTITKKTSNGVTLVYLKAKKTGTAKVSFKTGGKTYSVKVTVKKYVNPVSSITIGSTKLSSSKFKTAASYDLKYSKYKNKSVKVTVKLKSGWSISNGYTKNYIEYAENGWLKTDGVKNGKKITVEGGAGFFILVDVVNDSTGQTERITVNFV